MKKRIEKHKVTTLNTKDLFKWSKNRIITEIVAISDQKSAGKEAMKEFFTNKLSIAGLFILIGLIITAVVVVFTSQWDITIGSSDILSGSTKQHWFGTDDFGRDLWTRLWYGLLVSSVLAIIASTINIIIGIIVGISQGYFKTVDKILTPIIKILYSLPSILILILFSTVFGASMIIVVVSLVITGWVGPSQQIRGQTLRTRNQDFIIASQTLGTGWFKILGTFFTLAIPTIIIQFTMLFPKMILVEATLGFLGLSVPDIPTLGTLINSGRAYILSHPMQVFYPIISLVTIVASVQFIGFGIESAFGTSRTVR